MSAWVWDVHDATGEELGGFEHGHTPYDELIHVPLIMGKTKDDRTAFSEATLCGRDRIAMRLTRSKHIYNPEEKTGELFGWRPDPGEDYDLARDNAARAEKMRSRLLEFYNGLLEQKDTLSVVQPVDMSPKRIDQLRSLGYIR